MNLLELELVDLKDMEHLKLELELVFGMSKGLLVDITDQAQQQLQILK